MTSFLGFPNRVTANGALPQEALARLDVWIGELMAELKTLGIAENTLVILMADNGPFTHNGPSGMAETLYRGGKGDYLEGGVRVPAMAWWPSVIAPGQTVGDIIHETDLFTTFAHLAGATEHIPTRPHYRRHRSDRVAPERRRASAGAITSSSTRATFWPRP